MKTFGFLVGGWVVGGAVVFALGATTSRPDYGAVPASAGRLEARGPAGRMPALLMPVSGAVASRLHDDFSQPRSGGRTHEALDILAPYGTPVVAAVDGTIRKLLFSRAGGVTIYQFDPSEERVYYYAHLDRYANGLSEGMFVAQGTVIGYVGTSGNTHGTPHLHFAIGNLPPTKEWWKGTPIDPYPILTQ